MFVLKPLLVIIALNAITSSAQVFNECTVDDDFTGVPGNCANFRRCVNGRFIEMTCAPGTLFDASNKICEHAVLVNCLSRNLPQEECGEEDDFSPVEDDCSKFLRCDHGYFIELKCPKGTLFDRVKKYCEYAELVDCSYTQPSATTQNTSTQTVATVASTAVATTFETIKPAETTTVRSTSLWDLITNTTPPSWTPPPFGCTAFDDFSGVWNDCHKYKRCFDGYFFVISCPDDWKFDYIFKQCLDPKVDDVVCYMPPPSLQRK